MGIKELLIALILVVAPAAAGPIDEPAINEIPSTGEIIPPPFELDANHQHFKGMPEELWVPNFIFSGIYGGGVVYTNETLGVLYIRGAIDFSTASLIINQINIENIHTVDIHSAGGSLDASYMIATFIRDNDLDTYVRPYGMCYSGCTTIFQAGKNRTAATTAQFMYHYAKYDGGMHFSEKYQYIEDGIHYRATQDMWRFMEGMGLSSKFTETVIQGTDSFHSARDMMEHGAVTALDDGHWKPIWLEAPAGHPFGVY